MGILDNIIQVNVTAAAQAVATDSFAIPLILGPGKSEDAPAVITCTQASDLLSQGYKTDDVAYTYAEALCSQAVKPATFKVASRSADGGIDDDIAAVREIDDTWYALLTPKLADADILTAATAIEALPKIYIAASSSADIGASGKEDIASLLQSKSLERTALIFSPDSAELGIDAAWVGGQLPKAPGSTTWAYKVLNGISADTLTPSQQNIAFGVPVAGIQGKAVNVYQKVGGVSVVLEGTLASGGFIDTRIGVDSLRSAMRSNAYQAVISNGKIPYTDAGAVIFESAVRTAIDTHVGYGFIDGTSPITVTHTPVSQVPQTQRAKRIGPDIQFSCRTAGAQHAVVITGVVSL